MRTRLLLLVRLRAAMTRVFGVGGFGGRRKKGFLCFRRLGTREGFGLHGWMMLVLISTIGANGVHLGSELVHLSMWELVGVAGPWPH